MRHFFDWFAQHHRPEEPWLILGKGPSFASRDRYDLGGYRLLSLNHAVREQPVLVAHAIDLNVVAACEDVLESNAGFLVMPWYPHVDNRPGSLSLDQARADLPVLDRLAKAGRLLWYDLSTSRVRHGPGPVVRASYFSAEAGLSLLALAGVRRVRTLGVDGGSDYSNCFDDLKDKTLLANGRTSFDLQFEGFARTILETGVDVATLTAPAPIRVCVAHTEAETLPAAVLQHSIRRHASLSVAFVAPSSLDGPAIVVSPRNHCVADVRPLWLGGVGDREIAIPTQPAHRGDPVGLALVGAGAGAELPRVANLLREGSDPTRFADRLGELVTARLHPDWNPGTLGQRRPRFVRYPGDGSEPWLSRFSPDGHLWVCTLLDALDRGFISSELVSDEVRRGHVRPSLAYQVEQRIEEPLLLPRRARLLDREFGRGRSGLMAASVAVAQALARRMERRIVAGNR